MSHNGMVAFSGGLAASPPASGIGLFTYTIGGKLPFQELIESNPGFTSPSINDHGQIAAAAATEIGGPQTLFLIGPGGPQALIVRGTTMIGGQTVTGTLGINPNFVGLNDLGTVVVSTSLSGGTAVITPTLIVAEAGQTISGKNVDQHWWRTGDQQLGDHSVRRSLRTDQSESVRHFLVDQRGGTKRAKHWRSHDRRASQSAHQRLRRDRF